MPVVLLWLKKLRQILEVLSLKLMIESELLSIKIGKCYTENWSREIFIIDSVLKTNPYPLTYKIKDLNGEKIIISF